MATYSSNTTIKIQTAISNSTTSGTLYTCPANSYAIVQVSYNGNSADVLSIGGQDLVKSGNSGQFTGIYVGPGQAVIYMPNISGTGKISGVEFKNTP
jgi:lipoate-protein ligase B